MPEKLCPLRGGVACLGAYCAWWREYPRGYGGGRYPSECAVLALANSVQGIEDAAACMD